MPSGRNILIHKDETLKIKIQELRTDAMQVRSQIDILFSDETVSEEQINNIKDGFKILKNFAQLNMRFLDARSQAENARQILDDALKSPSADPKLNPELQAIVESPSSAITSDEQADEQIDEQADKTENSNSLELSVEVPAAKVSKKK